MDPLLEADFAQAPGALDDDGCALELDALADDGCALVLEAGSNEDDADEDALEKMLEKPMAVSDLWEGAGDEDKYQYEADDEDYAGEDEDG